MIDIVKRGGLARGDYTIYGISDRWEKFGTHNFKAITRQKGTRLNEALKKYQKERRKEQSRASKLISIPAPPSERTYKIYPDGSKKRLIKRRNNIR